MDKLDKDTIGLLGEVMVRHSIATLDAFDELPEDATKEQQSAALAGLAVTGMIDLVSVLVGCGVIGKD